MWQVLQDKVAEQQNLHVLLNHNIKELREKNKLVSILVEDKNSNESKELNYDGVIVFIGLTPNNDLPKETAKLDQLGFVKTEHMMTNPMCDSFSKTSVRTQMNADLR